ncbi:MAG: NADH:flavin oxidoreductase/NADH oxidase [Chthoniobacter sp.]|uniref:NADH:flavin oxidoreductase/NADH oxidase n=1 Tax=Chthoniobacter sp. TaxID=2510640 RepID=UPI0032A9BD47
MPDLFSEFQLRSVRLKNRIAVSPMCQYSAVDGVVNDWHFVHLGALAVGGAGLVIAEATGVAPEGRITPGDTGLWNDAQAEAWRPIVRFIEAQGAVPGIQIAHAGRKASASRPWEGDSHLPADHPEAWQPIAPSALAFGADLPRVPRAMTLEDIARVRKEFVAAAQRARDVGFKWLVLHFAHGYLGQSFFSPLANHRADEYGGSFENRARFLLETLDSVRAVWPVELPLTARLGVLDYVEGEQPMEESIELVRRMKAGGLDLIDVSMGFNTPDVSRIPWGEHAFLAPIAKRIGREAGLPTSTSWNISDPTKTDALIRTEQVDLVMIAKALLSDPHWPYHAAQALGREMPQKMLPDQYAYWLKRP